MDCNQEMMLDHEGRITKAQESADSAHKRVNEIALLIKDFTVPVADAVGILVGKLVLTAGQSFKASSNTNSALKITLSLLETK
jgi:hypothetical protein